MPFAKGQSGNPRGRPKKGEALTDILRTLAHEPPTQRSKYTRKEAVARKLWQMAIGGDIAAIKYLYDRIDGKPTEQVELTGQEGGPLQVQFVAPERFASPEAWAQFAKGGRQDDETDDVVDSDEAEAGK